MEKGVSVVVCCCLLLLFVVVVVVVVLFGGVVCLFGMVRIREQNKNEKKKK